MFNFDNEIIESLGISKADLKYKFLNIGGQVLYLIGYKEIIKYQPDEIVFKLNSKEFLHIMGVNLIIREMDNNGVMVCGKIIDSGVK